MKEKAEWPRKSRKGWMPGGRAVFGREAWEEVKGRLRNVLVV